jgi:phosphoribosylformimino-5-aminoimidazole carboxamide ribonucleotide (ProFAR) isomerase
MHVECSLKASMSEVSCTQRSNFRLYDQLELIGGINAGNAMTYLEAGASHVIVTSYVFENGRINFERLEELLHIIGKDRLVLDLSCRRRADDSSGKFYVVTNKWTKFTDFELRYVVNVNLLITPSFC